MFLRVAEFHRAFGAYIATEPALPSADIRQLRISLIREELNEYCDAYMADDRIEMADALADLLYVLAGTAVAYGIAPDEPVESSYVRDPPIAERLTGVYSNYLRDDFSLYLRAEETNDLEIIQSAIYHMMVEIFGIAWQCKIPINEVFAEVHNSNMSKLDIHGKPILREDGKILKTSPLFSPPDIAGVLERVPHA
jgi:predicted HAD superfamily Cof-like phosphohydrolase